MSSSNENLIFRIPDAGTIEMILGDVFNKTGNHIVETVFIGN